MRVFTYGSLMKGLANHRVMERAGGHFCRSAIIEGLQLREYCAHFPCAVRIEGYKTEGEIYNVSLEGLEHLDRLESEGFFYHRVKMTTLAGEEVSVYVLDAQSAHGSVIDHGSWRTHKLGMRRYYRR